MGLETVNDQNPVKKETHFDNWTWLHIQVRDASTIFLARTRAALEVPGPGATQGGLAITAALNIVTLRWLGDLFIKGSNPSCLYNIETFEDVPQQVTQTMSPKEQQRCAA